MLPKWTGDVVRTLHVNRIEIRELAAKMGCALEYLGKILNGKREPKNAEAKVKEALEELDKGRAFLTKGGVFSDDFIDAYIELKSEEEIKVRTFVHPLEYDLYYSV